VKPDVALCPHLGSASPLPLAVAPDDVLAWHDGPVTAVAGCTRCPRRGLLEMLDEGSGGATGVRIYALAGLEPEAWSVYRRNVRSGSCDLGRAARETEALLSAAGPVQRLVALDVATGAVLAAAPPPPGLPLPQGPWHARVSREDDASWLDRLGLEKGKGPR